MDPLFCAKNDGTQEHPNKFANETVSQKKNKRTQCFSWKYSNRDLEPACYSLVKAYKVAHLNR